jgi:DNA invertase Pin-like site-specific DNA recombinase
LVVHDLDRAFRSTVDALLHAEILKKRGVSFQILSLNIDTNTESGALIYSVLAAFSQWERQCLQRRTREGMAAAKRAGINVGRPRKLTKEQITLASAKVALRQSTITAEAKKLGVCRDTLSKALVR